MEQILKRKGAYTLYKKTFFLGAFIAAVFNLSTEPEMFCFALATSSETGQLQHILALRNGGGVQDETRGLFFI